MNQNQSTSRAEQIRRMRDRTVPAERQQEYWTDAELQGLPGGLHHRHGSGTTQERNGGHQPHPRILSEGTRPASK